MQNILHSHCNAFVGIACKARSSDVHSDSNRAKTLRYLLSHNASFRKCSSTGRRLFLVSVPVMSQLERSNFMSVPLQWSTIICIFFFVWWHCFSRSHCFFRVGNLFVQNNPVKRMDLMNAPKLRTSFETDINSSWGARYIKSLSSEVKPYSALKSTLNSSLSRWNKVARNSFLKEKWIGFVRLVESDDRRLRPHTDPTNPDV